MIIVEIINTKTDDIKLVRKRSYKDGESFIKSYNKHSNDSFARFELSENLNKAICDRMTKSLQSRLNEVGHLLK